MNGTRRTEVVLDVETQYAFSEIARPDPGLLRISLVGIYQYALDRYQAFREEELPKLWPILEESDRIIGFNLFAFDYPVLNAYAPRPVHRLPTLDIFAVAQAVLGFRVGLDAVATSTLGYGKTGHGLDALKWFREGKWDVLEKYCLDDVRVTKDVYEFGLREKYLKYANRRGAGQFPVDFSYTVPEKSVNLRLPL